MANLSHPTNRRAFLKSAGFTGGGLLLAGPHLADAAPPLFPLFSADWANASEQGIVGDGKTKNTAAIKTLIQRLHADGGGTIYFGPGIYLTGPIHFASNLTLWLDAGATLRFTDDFDDYLPMVPSRWQGLDVSNFSPLIYAHQVHNIAILGRGTIDGSGAAWWEYVGKLRQASREKREVPSSRWQDLFRELNGRGESFGFLRPSLFQTLHAKDILVQGVQFINSPFWTTHFVESENIVVDGVSIRTPDSPNTDGINPESSRNVRISNCYIHTDDDCVTIKSGKERAGEKPGSACENITITNCVMTAGAAGVGVGSEMSGSVRRVTISNCVFDGTGHGLHIKTIRGRGGIVEDIAVSNIVMHNIHRHPAIHLNMKYWVATTQQPVGAGTPRFRNISINGVRGSNLKNALVVSGLEEMPVENLSLSNLDLSAETGIQISHAKGVRIADTRIGTTSGSALTCEYVSRLEVSGLSIAPESAPATRILLRNVNEAALTRCAVFETTEAIVALEGAETAGIQIFDSGLRRTGAVKLGPDVPPAAVTPSNAS
jgi:polygalacturonase